MLYSSILFLFLSLVDSLARGAAISYPRPSIYNKSGQYSLKVNGTYMNTVSYAGYDYVQISMSSGYATEFRIAATQETSISSYSINPQNLNIAATTSGNELIFSLLEKHYLIVTINNVKEFIIMVDDLETNVPGSSGPNIFNVVDYGATPNTTAITSAFQAAAYAAGNYSSSGAGIAVVYIPAGLYYVGNVKLQSHTQLYLEGGSVIRFTGKQSDYTALFTKSGVGPGTWWFQTEPGSSDISITGRGTFDGNGYYSLNTGKFIADQIVPVGTSNFYFNGPLVRDSSFWGVTPIQSSNVTFKNLKILNRQDVGQDDGIDVMECENVLIQRAIAIALDDSFSTKTWPFNTGTTVPYPYQPQALSNVVFDDCLAWTDCYGYKVGQGVYEDQDAVTFKNSVVYRAAVGIGIDHRYGTAAATGITFDNIDIQSLSGVNAGHATWLAFFIESEGAGIGPLNNLAVRNMRVRQTGIYNGTLLGYNSSAIIDGVSFENIYMLQNTTSAKTLADMKILDVAYVEDVTIM
jgi:polygalacturonase